MKIIKAHILFWSCFFLAAYTIDSINDPDTTLVKELIFFTSQNLFLFYGLTWFLKHCSSATRLKFAISIARLCFVILAFIALRYFIRYYFLATFFQKEYGDLPVKKWFTTCFTWIINSFFYALAYFYFQTSLKKQKALQKGQEEKLKSEQEILALENERLRAQINPHFLFNTLNYFYSKVNPVQPEVADGIAVLADIMRSSIRTPDADGKIPLEEEIYNIEQLIGIYQLRYDHKVFVRFTREGDAQQLRILPQALNTLVENGFKHGELHDPAYPLHIHLVLDDQLLTCIVANKIRQGPKENSHGIGMRYIRTCLSNTYKDRYSLVVDETECTYSVRLRVELGITSV